jgi:hypothetical protein
MAQVEVKAATLGLDRNAGVEMALEAFVQDDDGPSATILQLRNQLAELKAQMVQAAATTAPARRAATAHLRAQTEQIAVELTMSDEDKRTEHVTVPLSPREVALIGEVRGKAPTSQWIREAALRELARGLGVETVDMARRSAPRRRNYAERGKIAAKEGGEEQ